MSSVMVSPKMFGEIDGHSIIEFIGEIADLTAAHWLPSKAPRARISGKPATFQRSLGGEVRCRVGAIAGASRGP